MCNILLHNSKCICGRLSCNLLQKLIARSIIQVYSGLTPSKIDWAIKVTGYKNGVWSALQMPNNRIAQSHLTMATKGGAQIPCMSSLLWAAKFCWTQIWPSKQPKMTNSTLDRQVSMYLRARQSVLLQASFFGGEIAPYPVKLYTPHNFRPL